jgi:hypothetical protein
VLSDTVVFFLFTASLAVILLDILHISLLFGHNLYTADKVVLVLVNMKLR